MGKILKAQESTPPVWAAWGKSGGRDRYHPLVCHAVDTAAVAEQMFPLLLGQRMRDALRLAFMPLGDAVPWIAVLCGLHDVGKYSPTFQALDFALSSRLLGGWALRDLEVVQRPVGLAGRVDTPHGLLTAVHMKDLLVLWGATPETALTVAVVLGGHHGYFPSSQEFRHARGQRNNHGEDTWSVWRTELALDVVRLRGLPDPRDLPWQDVRLPVDAALGLAALTTVSDWVASDNLNFPSPESGFDLDSYATSLEELADAAVAKVMMGRWSPPENTTFSALFPDVPPRPVQSAVERLTSDLGGPVLVLVEAPTGEGKSKAALQAASAMVRQLGQAGFYVGMPTQATSNQMLAEVEDMLASVGDPTPVHLVHSGARDFLAERSTTPSDVGRDESGEQDVVARTWFTRKKNLLSALGSGTVDQVMKGAIRSGHVFVRLVALSNKVVVIDEVHAYDTYMSTLLDRLLMWLGSLGTPVVLLSATLPSGRRQELVAAWQAGLLGCAVKDIPRLPASEVYPRVTVADAGSPEVHAAEVSEVNKARTIHLETVAAEDVVGWLLGHAAAGRCVAVVHNLVKRAIATHDDLAKRIAALPENERPLMIAINGPMAARERREAEEMLRVCFGKNGTRPAAIVVGTQVLEQSLDLDFDVMLSDVAPIDAVIQRAGRVHRHDRGESRGPQVLGITGVVDTPTGPRFPPYLRNVYAPIVLMRTWAVLKDRDKIESPDEVPGLVDCVYEAEIECPPGWEEAWRKGREQLAYTRDHEKKIAAAMYLPPPHAVDHLSALIERSRNPGKTRKSRGDRR